MEIRKAGLEDLKEICRMGYQLSLDMSALEPGYFAVAEQKEAPMRQAVLEETKDIFLAESAGKIVGFACVWQCEPKPEENYLVPGKFAYLSDLVLLPESRGMGIGSALLEACKNWARERGIFRMKLDSLCKNEVANHLYEREGFRPVVQTMWAEL
ncbi:GNAT family N-acetyltransferase [Christensenellaceae bacterium 44-20]